MAEVSSTMALRPGERAPEFTLPDANGAVFCLDDVRGPRGLVVAFVCNHCPFVIHVADCLAEIADHYGTLGIGFVAINPNDVENYPDDAPDRMPAFAKAHNWDFPYLCDDSQEVAKAYAAACTPDFYLFDGELRLAYCGQLDDSRPRNRKPATGADLRAALDGMLAGEPPLAKQVPSSGCNIKWRPDNLPDYF